MSVDAPTARAPEPASPRATGIREREANEFAMQLLMPDEFLRRDIAEMGGVDIEDDSAMAKLAKRYGVSTTLMAIRVGQLLRWNHK